MNIFNYYNIMQFSQSMQSQQSLQSMQSIETHDILFHYNNIDTPPPDIHLEIYRGELYCNLLKVFTRSCTTNLTNKVLSHKKTINRTITNLLSSWFFTLYQYYDFKKDAFFPSNYNYMETLTKTLEDYCSLENNSSNSSDINHYTTKIQNIINDLTHEYTIILQKLNKYIQPNYNINVKKNIIIQMREEKEIEFVKLYLDTKSFSITNSFGPW